MILIIMSGGQTGADRAALDFAIDSRIIHDGFCPKGRIAEDGPLDQKYHLTETSSEKYPQRTEKNVMHSSGTVIFNGPGGDSRGSKLTMKYCTKHTKPCLFLVGYGPEYVTGHAKNLFDFIKRHSIERLNVAGNRESKSPGIYNHVRTVLAALPLDAFHPSIRLLKSFEHPISS